MHLEEFSHYAKEYLGFCLWPLLEYDVVLGRKNVVLLRQVTILSSQVFKRKLSYVDDIIALLLFDKFDVE